MERFAGEVELPNRLPRNSSGVDALLDKALIARLLSSAAQISPALSLEHGAVLEKEQVGIPLRFGRNWLTILRLVLLPSDSC